MLYRAALAIAVAVSCPLAIGLMASPASGSIGTVRVASGLNRPVGLAHAPGDEERLFIVEKPGRVRILNLETGSVNSTPFLDIASMVSGGTTQNDERGLLGMAFHPDYDDNGFFYVYYFATNSSMRLARYSVSSNPDVADTSSALTMLEVPQFAGNHNGGWIDFGPDGYLYIASGDGGGANDTGNNSQNPNNLLGTMLRIDVDNHDAGLNYGIPADNPLVGQSGRDEIWAYGLRNPWRNSFDRLTGDLYMADVGQGAWEEVNFQPASSIGGENWGWRCYEGNAPFNTSGCDGPSAYDFPFHVYPIGGQPECAITGGYVYRGSDIPSLYGRYIFGDYCSAKIWALVFDGNDVTEFNEITSQLSPSTDGHSINWISSFGEDAQGEMYIVTQPFASNGGSVFKIISTAEPAPDNNDCENAIVIGDGTTVTSNDGATTTGPDEPDDCSFFGDSNIQADIWFSYTATCTGDLTVDLCASDYAAKVGVYGSTCPTGSGEILACNTAGCGSTRGTVTLSATAGETYLIRIGGHNGATGEAVIDISCDPVDLCIGDLNGDGVVDVSDLLILLGAWGECPRGEACPADLNDDGTVDVSDLLILLGAWGACD